MSLPLHDDDEVPSLVDSFDCFRIELLHHRAQGSPHSYPKLHIKSGVFTMTQLKSLANAFLKGIRRLLQEASRSRRGGGTPRSEKPSAVAIHVFTQIVHENTVRMWVISDTATASSSAAAATADGQQQQTGYLSMTMPTRHK